MIKVHVVEDQKLLLDALATILAMENDIEVCACSKNGVEALKKMRDTPCDILLTDIEMPEMGGMELIQNCQKKNIAAKFVVMTTFSKPGYVKRAIEMGLHGFVLKESPSELLIKVLRRIHSGLRYIEPELSMLALGEIDPLSEKERKALKLAHEGLKTAEISELLFLSPGTVRNYLSEAISKLNATNRIDAARIAHQKGWL